MIGTLAFRHLLVKKARSLFLLLGFSIGVGVMIVLLSVGEAMLDQSRDVSLVGGGEVTVLPQGIDIEAMRTIARERFQVAFAGGLGPFTGKAFRIGHLGDLNPAMILGCLGGIEAAMQVQGIPFGRDGVARAVACFAAG